MRRGLTRSTQFSGDLSQQAAPTHVIPLARPSIETEDGGLTAHTLEHWVGGDVITLDQPADTQPGYRPIWRQTADGTIVRGVGHSGSSSPAGSWVSYAFLT